MFSGNDLGNGMVKRLGTNDIEATDLINNIFCTERCKKYKNIIFGLSVPISLTLRLTHIFYVNVCKFVLPPHGISGRRIRQVAVTLYLGEERHQEGGARVSECTVGEGHHQINSVHRPAIPLFTRLFSVGG
jgi:hypothetical protein